MIQDFYTKVIYLQKTIKNYQTNTLLATFAPEIQLTLYIVRVSLEVKL